MFFGWLLVAGWSSDPPWTGPAEDRLNPSEVGFSKGIPPLAVDRLGRWTPSLEVFDISETLGVSVATAKPSPLAGGLDDINDGLGGMGEKMAEATWEGVPWLVLPPDAPPTDEGFPSPTTT